MPKSDFVRLTGLFRNKTKKGNLVGTARPEDLKQLVPVIKEALGDDKGIVFFVVKSKFDTGPPYYLSAAIDRGNPARPEKPRRKIEEEDEDDFTTSEREEIDL